MTLQSAERALKALGRFDVVLDVGGNIGEWAELARGVWPTARLTSFEPVPELAEANRNRALGRWWVETVGISSTEGVAELHVCVNQHSASTMQMPGTVRRDRFGIVDRYNTITVQTRTLDSYFLDFPPGRLLIKIDVEGHEGLVLQGAPDTLDAADVVIIEVQQSPDIFVGSESPSTLDEMLGYCGLGFAGVLDCLADPSGEVVQFDGIWIRRDG